MKKLGVFVGDDIFSLLTCQDLIRSSRGDYNFVVFFPTPPKSDNAANDVRKLSIYERSVIRDYVYPFIDSNEKNCIGRYTSPKKLFPSYNIDYINVDNINDDVFLREVSKLDGVISVRCYQKFSPQYMEIFRSKGRILWNLHPGDLPKYRGVMTLYRAMANSECYCSLTLHELTEDWDAGPILSKHTVPLDINISFLENMMHLGVMGGWFLLSNLYRTKLPERPLAIQQTCSSYWGKPTENELSLSNKHGVCLVHHDRVKRLYSHLFIGQNNFRTKAIFEEGFDQYIKGAKL